MIRVFGPTDTNFSSNGDAVLRPLKAKVHKEDNGDYYLDLDTGLEYVDYLKEGNIIVADTPQGAQAFRVTNPSKTKTRVSVRAYHVFYDSENYLIADSNVVDKNCNDALANLNAATEPTSPFTTWSNVGTVDSFRCVRQSLYEAIQTVIERWGGHLVRDNFSIQIRASIGVDNGVVVRYRKNLKDITCEEVWNDVVTKILPEGKDGILLNAVDPTESIYISSTTQYAIPYTKTVIFDQSHISEDDYKDQSGEVDEDAYKRALVADLRVQATQYVAANCIPKINYTLTANIDKVTDIGDIVEVIDERLGIDILTNIIAFEYDCILKKYTQIEFGNFKNTLSGFISNVTGTIDKSVTEKTEAARAAIGQEVQQATNSIWQTLGDSYVIFDGDKILVVDSLPKESATNALRINNTGISFSNSGINGLFIPVLGIDGNLQSLAANIIHLTSDLIETDALEVNGVDISPNVITRSLSNGITPLTASAYTIVPLDQSIAAGSKLTPTADGGILVGANVSKVLVSATLAWDSIATTGSKHVRIVKNAHNNANTLAWTQRTIPSGQSGVCEIIPILAEVQEGDIIHMYYYTTDSGDKIAGNAWGKRTSLTVQVIE